eukprot:4921113-Pleurochrysis_carterae.AAC.2
MRSRCHCQGARTRKCQHGLRSCRAGSWLAQQATLEERAEHASLLCDDEELLEALHDDRGKIRFEKVPLKERIDWLVNNCW